MGAFEEQLRQCEKIVEMTDDALLAKILVRRAKIKWWMMGLYLTKVAYPDTQEYTVIRPLWWMDKLYRRRMTSIRKQNPDKCLSSEIHRLIESYSTIEATRLKKEQNTKQWLNLTKEMSQFASQD